MPDDNNDSTLDKAFRRYEDALHDHKRMTGDDLAKVKRELLDELEKAKKESSEHSAQEIKELREAVADLTAWVTEKRTAEKEKDRVADSEATIVVPPNDVTPAPPAEPEEPVYGDDEQQSSKRWKKLW